MFSCERIPVVGFTLTVVDSRGGIVGDTLVASDD